MTARTPCVVALVLAAGRSTRMAPHNKLLLRDASGVAMAARVAATCGASRADRVIVVTGHQAAEVAAAVRRAPVREGTVFVHAPDHASGLSASLRAGIAALPEEAGAALVCLGDMPGVASAMMDQLIAASTAGASCDAVVPVWQGRRGNPVLWHRRHFTALRGLQGDQGARALLRRPGMVVVEVPADGPAVLVDCDTPEQAGAAGFGAAAS